MYYPLHRDRNVVYGGSWYDPADEEFIEVMDVDVGRDYTSVNYIERGTAPIRIDDLEKALRSHGYFTEEEPTALPKGRKQWFAEDMTPPPKPGHLLWVPEPIKGPGIMHSWEEWKAFQRAGAKFEEIPAEMRSDVLLAADAYLAYHGSNAGHESPRVVINRADITAKLRREYPNAIISSNPEKAIWKELKKMGVRREVDS